MGIGIGFGLIIMGIVFTVIVLKQGAQVDSAAPAAAAAPAAKRWKCCSDTDNAVLWIIPLRSIEDSDAAEGRIGAADLARYREKIARLREFAATLEDGPIKDSWLGWLAHFERMGNKAEEELQTGALRKKRADDAARRNAEIERIRALIPTLPKP